MLKYRNLSLLNFERLQRINLFIIVIENISDIIYSTCSEHLKIFNHNSKIIFTN